MPGLAYLHACFNTKKNREEIRNGVRETLRRLKDKICVCVCVFERERERETENSLYMIMFLYLYLILSVIC